MGGRGDGGVSQWGVGGSSECIIFIMNPNLKKKNSFGGWGGVGAGVSEFFFTKNPNLKKKKKKKNFFFIFFFLGGGGAVGWGVGEGLVDGQTDMPKLICPFNFFEVGGITMH